MIRAIVVVCAALTAVSGAGAQELFLDGAPKIDAEQGKAGTTLAGAPKLTDLARELSPAVVNISVEGEVDELPEGGEERENRREPSSPIRSLGSGFIINETGYIVTSNHVIDKAKKVIVRLLDDKTDYPAKVIGKDPKTDIALLKIDTPKSLPCVFFGDSDALLVGEWVMAIGNQFQLGQTVTAGVVSAKARRVPVGGGGPYDAFIQTDASINPGSSGGPLFNTSGQVVGINTAIFSPGRGQFGGTGFNIGIGFAIPVNQARSVLTQLHKHGKVTRGLLGVLIQRVDAEIVKALNLESQTGALVSDVLKDSPAQSAGFKRKDLILTFHGKTVREHDDLPLMVANTPIGTSVPVEILRKGAKQTIAVIIGELKEDSALKRAESGKPDVLGLIVDSVSEETAKALEFETPHGVVVTLAEPGSIAERGGLSRGDVIEEMDDKIVGGLKEYRDITNGFKEPGKDGVGDRTILVLVRRKEGTRYATITVGK